MKSNQELKRRKKIKKRKKSLSLFQVVAIVFLAYFGYTFFEQQIKINKYNSQIALYNQEIEAKQSLVEYYNNQNENISTDEYIESVAREKLGLVKPYETVYVDANK